MHVGRLRSSDDEPVVFRPVDDSEVAAWSNVTLASCTLAGRHGLTKLAICLIGMTDEAFSSSKQERLAWSNDITRLPSLQRGQ
jgi:hypothetical protein